MDTWDAGLLKLMENVTVVEEAKQQLLFFAHLNPEQFTADDHMMNGLDSCIEQMVTQHSFFLGNHYSSFLEKFTPLFPSTMDSYYLFRDYYIKFTLSSRAYHCSHFQVINSLTKKWNWCKKQNEVQLFFPELDAFHDYLCEIYSTELCIYSLTFQALLENCYGQSFVDYFLAQLESYRGKLKAAYQRLTAKQMKQTLGLQELSFCEEKCLSFFNYFIQKMQPLLESLSITVVFQEECSVQKYHHHRMIVLPPYQSFPLSLHHFLALFAEIYAEQYVAGIESDSKKIFTQDYTTYTLIEYCQLLPILTKDFSILIDQFLHPNTPRQEKRVNRIYQELLCQYLMFKHHPLQLNQLNFLEHVIIELMSMTIEEKWVNRTIDSSELPQLWNQQSDLYFHEKPRRHMEGMLRMTEWTKEKIGTSFLHLTGLLSAFDNGLIWNHSSHPLSKVLQAIRKDELDHWKPEYHLTPKYFKKADQCKTLLLFIQQLYQKLDRILATENNKKIMVQLRKDSLHCKEKLPEAQDSIVSSKSPQGESPNHSPTV